MKVALAPRHDRVERSLARAVSVYVFVEFLVPGAGFVVPPKVAALLTMSTALLLGIGVLPFETIEARRSRRGPS